MRWAYSLRTDCVEGKYFSQPAIAVFLGLIFGHAHEVAVESTPEEWRTGRECRTRQNHTHGKIDTNARTVQEKKRVDCH